jgi:hypothetical protein
LTSTKCPVKPAGTLPAEAVSAQQARSKREMEFAIPPKQVRLDDVDGAVIWFAFRGSS